MLLLIPLRFKQTIRNHILCGHRRPWLRPPRRRRRCCRSPSPKSVLIRFSLFDWLYELFSFWQISFASKVAAAQVLGCSGGQKERDENQSRRHSDEIGSGPDHRVGAWKNIKKWKITIFGGEPWSCGYGRQLMFKRSWVQIPAPYSEWTWHFFTLICYKNCIICLKRPKINKKEGWSIFKKITIFMGSDVEILQTKYKKFQ